MESKVYQIVLDRGRNDNLKSGTGLNDVKCDNHRGLLKGDGNLAVPKFHCFMGKGIVQLLRICRWSAPQNQGSQYKS